MISFRHFEGSCREIFKIKNEEIPRWARTQSRNDIELFNQESNTINC